jgi:hypothetical protein
MTSSTPGATTSPAEVVNMDQHGIWLVVGDTEYFLPYEDFPWFRQATVENILVVELLHGDHLRWPALDVDLSLDSLTRPETFPLIFKGETDVGRF